MRLMKKLVCTALLLCFSLLHAQDRFFLYGKVLGADGMPLPSAQVSLTTVIERRPITATQAASDGSFKLVVAGHALAMLKFTGADVDSFLLPLLLTTEQRTLNVTVRLAHHAGDRSDVSMQHASLQMQYENTELGIAEKLMVSMMEEKRLAAKMDAVMVNGGRADSLAVGGTAESGMHYRDPDTLLAKLGAQIIAEQLPLHRDAFLLRYVQLRTETKREGNPAIVKMVLGAVEPASPFWSLVPELIRASAPTAKEYADYVRRVKALTPDPELKAWLETHL
jgi:hypothetical protein